MYSFYLPMALSMIICEFPVKSPKVVIKGDSSRTVRICGHVLREVNPAMEVQSAFFFRGRFTDYADVGVLLLKDWI